jgi:hypothetical protein
LSPAQYDYLHFIVAGKWFRPLMMLAGLGSAFQ